MPLAENDGLRILVVDDNEDWVTSMAMMLTMMGHVAHTAHDGEAAVVAAESFRPHVVLLDIGIPKLNGYEVARRIREQEWGESIYLIAVTGNVRDEDRRRSAGVGMNLHMIKPVESAALESLLLALRTGSR